MRRFYFQGQVKIDTVIKIENELFNHIINVNHTFIKIN